MKHTPLFSRHEALGGKIVDFAGWALPVQYSGIIKEHEAVRAAAGLFDVSHMGEIAIKGEGALDFMQQLVTGDAERLKDKQVLYSLMCDDDGGVVDDLLLYRRSAADFLLVVNASNTDKDFEWIKRHAPADLILENLSAAYAQLALQGPHAQTILQELTDFPLDEIPFFYFEPHIRIGGKLALVSRTGYTGEDGFEIYTAADDAPALWDAILDAGRAYGVVPVGLGARDTLRFEAGLPLYGHELDRTITPLEANLNPFVKLKKGVACMGCVALRAQKEAGVLRELVGIVMIDRGIPRHGCEVMHNGQVIGHITTGTYSPTLKENMGLALISRGAVKMDEELSVMVRSKSLQARRVPLPFYQKKYKK